MPETKALVLKAEGDVQMMPEAAVFKVVVSDNNKQKNTLYAKSVQVHNGMTVLTECISCTAYVSATVKVSPIVSTNKVLKYVNGIPKPNVIESRPRSAVYGIKAPIKIIRSDYVEEIDGLPTLDDMDSWAKLTVESALLIANEKQEKDNREQRVSNCRVLRDAVEEFMCYLLEIEWRTKPWIIRKLFNKYTWISSFTRPKTPEKRIIFNKYVQELTSVFFDEDVFDRPTFDASTAELLVENGTDGKR